MDLNEMRTERNRRLERIRKRRNTLLKVRGEYIGLTDADPIRRHVTRLYNLGWSYQALAAMTGDAITNQTVRHIHIGESPRVRRESLALLDVRLHAGVPARVPDPLFVPALGARRRIQALMAIGWSHDAITEAANGAATTRVLSDPDRLSVRAGTWRNIDAAYRLLSSRPGPSTRTKTRATRAGYGPPAAFDDIDNPSERAKGVARAA